MSEYQLIYCEERPLSVRSSRSQVAQVWSIREASTRRLDPNFPIV